MVKLIVAAWGNDASSSGEMSRGWMCWQHGCRLPAPNNYVGGRVLPAPQSDPRLPYLRPRRTASGAQALG